VMLDLGYGWLYANQNRHETALLFYDKILKKEPDYPLALVAKGNSLMAIGRLDESKRVLEKVLEKDPEDPYALAELGLVRYNEGNDKEAERLFKASIANVNQHYTCPYVGLGLVYMRRGEMDAAKKYFQTSINMNPEIGYQKYNGLAKIYLKEGRLNEAEKLLRKSIENYPYDDEAKKILEKVHRAREKESPVS
jgi:tetratricopeptide (TPR) repeat protein